MIRRNDGNDWLIISQVDHAHLAAELASVWGSDAVPALPLADLLVPAIRDHDDGWSAWERAPEIDQQTGWPRDFTEMPMAVSTGIWTESIERCSRGGSLMSAAHKTFQQFLDAVGLRLTEQRRIVLEIVLAQQVPFHTEDIAQIVGEMREDDFVSRSTIYRTVQLLHQAGVVRGLEHRSIKHGFEVIDPVPQPSTLVGIWVSRHFCWLAEKALATRQDNAEDRLAIERFLEQQSDLQANWRTSLGDQFTSGRIDTLTEAGFRYMQFFDRISLWLCCAEHSQPLEIVTPVNQKLRFVWRRSGSLLVEPYPLHTDSLQFSVSAQRVLATEYLANHEFQAALANAPRQALQWGIRR